jgi:hypothetical protein
MATQKPKLAKAYYAIPLFLFLTQGVAASMFKSNEENVTISSPFEGHITLNGKPAVGAKVERTLIWKDDIGETDSTTTDASGYFKLPAVNDTVKISPISTFVISQDISVTYENNTYAIWITGKSSTEMYSEFGGQPMNFRCELSDDEKHLRDNHSLITTRCSWDINP